jgi:AmmeMemoRadiSam system protein A
MSISGEARAELLRLARRSIELAFPHGSLQPCPLVPPSTELEQLRSTFITLRADQQLRGCCGSINASRTLAQDVWRNAWASAFCDPRFSPLTAEEWPRLHVHISVLTAPMPLMVRDEQELIDELRPGVDGLILELGAARATFLPAVWEQIPEAESFVRELKLKAGWSATFWSPQIKVSRYGAESFGE